MTVKELVEKLNKFPGDMPVRLSYDDVVGCEVSNVMFFHSFAKHETVVIIE